MLHQITALLPRPVGVRLRAWRAYHRGHNPELALLKHLHQGGMFVDIGANIGDYSRVACLIFAKVVAVEPIPVLAAKLRNELPEHVTVMELALSDGPGSATLFIPRERGATVSGLASLDRSANQAVDCLEIDVAVGTLDDLGLQAVDVIKIDVEGLEEQALRGGVQTLRRERPALIVEIEDRHHPGRTGIVFDMLAELGYRGFFLDGRDLRVVPVAVDDASYNHAASGRYIVNFVFLHPSRLYPSLQRRLGGSPAS